MRFCCKISLISGVIALLLHYASTKRTVVVNDNYKFSFEVVSAEAGSQQRSLRLWITAKTTGWVGFGVGPNPDMVNADIFIGGWNTSDSANRNYGADYFSSKNGRPLLDTVQNWFVESASEIGKVTTVQIRRLLDTKDTSQDQVITNTPMNVIWAFGPNDTVGYHGRVDRGSITVNFLKN